jgi:hypothetical protein
VQKKAAKFANHTSDLVWETLAQRRKIARICALFKAYTGKRTWKSLRESLKGRCYLSRDDHDHKILGPGNKEQIPVNMPLKIGQS